MRKGRTQNGIRRISRLSPRSYCVFFRGFAAVSLRLFRALQRLSPWVYSGFLRGFAAAFSVGLSRFSPWVCRGFICGLALKKGQPCAKICARLPLRSLPCAQRFCLHRQRRTPQRDLCEYFHIFVRKVSAISLPALVPMRSAPASIMARN